MRKIVINKCYGGFGLSDSARRALAQIKDVKEINNYDIPRSSIKTLLVDGGEYELSRDDPDLVAVVESMGKSSWGDYAHLKIVEIPEDVVWVVKEYDGMEHIAEVHRIWD